MSRRRSRGRGQTFNHHRRCFCTGGSRNRRGEEGFRFDSDSAGENMAHWRFLRGLFSPAGDEPPYAGRMATVADFCLRRFDQRLNTSQSHHIRKAREVSTLFLSIWSMIFLVFLLLKVSSLIFHR
ncbi:uncharacterized protein LOC9308282 isoform X2 [Arabidopsis lyrata subsp. lyrata]|nr:uncharacterized protein LOC9308282 isoform X2 [Arabidopsis lyrata subsp. lyrata]|eukprot:XP_020876784.1 uncharacterized protein LOC9308282 isoform X2 [Arabidopsis lyrata subsp. lyrata]